MIANDSLELQRTFNITRFVNVFYIACFMPCLCLPRYANCRNVKQ